ncbi:MAG TPA: hypothetical protein PLV87_16265 [Opitutaceae bacterium]|nr:hypothetical protein [Opitutaceae bacterium]
MTESPTTQVPEISEACFRRFLRLPASRPMEGPLEENATFVRNWYATHARPWIVSAHVALSVEGENLLVDGEAFPSGQLAARIGDRRSGFLIAVSAGPEAEEEAASRWHADEPDLYYFIECYASAVVETLLRNTCTRLGSKEFWCPGYREWPLAQMPRLLDLLTRKVTLPGPLRVLESGMLMPRKSQVALVPLATP